jgi:stress-induced morphogen
MTIAIRGSDDETLHLIEQALQTYEEQHPDAQIELYRQNSISVRIRVIDPAFAGLEKSDRHAAVWEHLEKLPEDVQSDVSMVVLLAPEEAKLSLANLEFEHPSPSLIK